MSDKHAETPIAVVIVNWNTWALCLACLDALRESEGVQWHLYLVDNASTDGSSPHLANLGDDVTFIQAPTDGGWTGGNNLGVQTAIEGGHQRFFILNSDALVTPRTLKKPSDFMDETRSEPIIGPVQLTPDEAHFNFAGSKLNASTNMPLPPETIATDSVEAETLPDYFPTAYVRGSGLFASINHFQKIGLFDDRFYLNYDDTEWCFSAREAGFDVIMLKSARLLHASSVWIGGAGSPLNIYFLTRNGLLFSQLHGNRRQRAAYLGTVLREGMSLTWQVGSLKRLRSLIFGRRADQEAFRAGVRDYLLGRFGDCPPQIRALQAASRATGN